MNKGEASRGSTSSRNVSRGSALTGNFAGLVKHYRSTGSTKGGKTKQKRSGATKNAKRPGSKSPWRFVAGASEETNCAPVVRPDY